MKERVNQKSSDGVPDEGDLPNTYRPSLWERVVAVVCAFIVIQVVLLLVLKERPFSDPNQVILIRTVLSLAIAVIGAVIPGFLNVRLKGKGASIRAGGALALFVITYYFTPKVAPDKLGDALSKIIDTPYVKREMKNLYRSNSIDLFDIEYVKLHDDGDEKINQSSAMNKLPNIEEFEKRIREEYENVRKYKEVSEAEIEAHIEDFMKSRKQAEATIKLAESLKEGLTPVRVNRKKKLKVEYRVKYIGDYDLESVTIHFGLYDKNETRVDQYEYSSKWVRGNAVLSEVVSIRTDKYPVIAEAKIDVIYIEKRGE